MKEFLQAGEMETFVETPDYVQAWQMILGQLKVEMSRTDFETWVKSLIPLGFSNDSQSVFRLGATNTYGRDWVDSRLSSTITNMLSGLFMKAVQLEVVVTNGFYQKETLDANKTKRSVYSSKVKSNSDQKKLIQADDQDSSESPRESLNNNKRKMMLERAYGSERASIIQPERGILITNYFMDHWTPIIGHSAKDVILAARRMCYWNVGTGEKRNIVETDMSILANKAFLSIRTVKSVLKNETIRKYFLRYKVRRVMTPNGVRTAGIILQVRMDDPLTPEDQKRIGILTDDTWYSPGFADENDEDESSNDELSAEDQELIEKLI